MGEKERGEKEMGEKERGEKEKGEKERVRLRDDEGSVNEEREERGY